MSQNITVFVTSSGTYDVVHSANLLIFLLIGLVTLLPKLFNKLSLSFVGYGVGERGGKLISGIGSSKILVPFTHRVFSVVEDSLKVETGYF